MRISWTDADGMEIHAEVTTGVYQHPTTTYHVVCTVAGRPLFLYRRDADGQGFACGEDVRKALRFVRAVASDVAQQMGPDWKIERVA